jgi:hypothetical protein
MDDLPSIVTVRAASDGQALMLGRDFFKSLPAAFMSILRGELLVRKQLLMAIIELKKMVVDEEAMRLVVKEIALMRERSVDETDPVKTRVWFLKMLDIAKSANVHIEAAQKDANESRASMQAAITEFEGMHARNLAIGLGMQKWFDRVYRTLREYGVPSYILKHTEDEAALLTGDVAAYDRIQPQERHLRKTGIDEDDVEEAITRSVRGEDIEPPPMTLHDPSLYNEIPQEVREAAPKSVSEETIVELAPVTLATPQLPFVPIGTGLPRLIPEDEGEDREDTIIGIQPIQAYLPPVEEPAEEPPPAPEPPPQARKGPPPLPVPFPQPPSRRPTPLGVKPQTLVPPPFNPPPMGINAPPVSQRDDAPEIHIDEGERKTWSIGISAEDLGTAPKK